MKNVFPLVLIPLLVLTISASFYRFVILKDYLVTYEGECDPLQHSCFTGCEDDACSEPYFYDLIEKRATDIYAQCGSDITGCELANICSGSEDSCSITYCDPATVADACETTDALSNDL